MKILKKIITAALILTALAMLASPVFAEEPAAENGSASVAVTQTQEDDNSTGSKAIAAAICVGIAATAGAIGMAVAISKSNESISRQPEAEGSIRTSLMLGLVFIETAIIYALIVAILIIFVL